MSAAEFIFTDEDHERFEQMNNGDSQFESEPLPPAPLWPDGVCPPDIDACLNAQARSIRVPVSMVAVPLMVSAGGTIGNAVELQLKPGWTVLPTLWAGLILEPGRKKTPAQLAGQWPVNALQKRLYVEWQAAMASYETDLQAWDAKPKGERGENPQPPQLDHLYTTDATMEALVGILSRGRGLTVFRDELAGFIGAMDKYRKGDDRQQWLSLWPGAPIKADRKAGGTTYATHPVAGVYGGIQPDYARELHSVNGQRDGMVERFLLWRPDVPRSGWTDDAVDPALLDPVVETFATLRSIRMRTMMDVATGIERVTVQLHPDARRRFIDWFNANDEATEQATGLRQGFYSKLDSQLARIALILHCLHNADDPRVMLSDTTMQSAIDVAEFFRAHLDRVLPLIGDRSTGEPVGLAARIIRYLRSPELQEGDGWVRRGRLLHKLSNVPADDLTTELSDLKRRGAVEMLSLIHI